MMPEVPILNPLTKDGDDGQPRKHSTVGILPCQGSFTFTSHLVTNGQSWALGTNLCRDVIGNHGQGRVAGPTVGQWEAHLCTEPRKGLLETKAYSTPPSSSLELGPLSPALGHIMEPFFQQYLLGPTM
jgi:hypothetical protein